MEISFSLDRKKILVFVFCSLAFFLMVFNFCRNPFGIAADKNWFKNWQADSEWLVQHRMWDSDKQGFFFNSGLLGANGNWKDKNFFEKHGAYTAQMGLQGFAFGIVYKITHSFGVCHWSTAFIFVLCVFAFLKWLFDEFGLAAAIFSYLLFFFNQWIIVSARNLYWVIWTFILPMIILLYFLKWEEKKGNLNFKIVAIVEAAAIFVKSGCGYEFITLVMINMQLPLFYYGFKNKWPLKKFLKRFLVLTVAALAGFFLAVTICLVQVYFYSNHSWAKAFNSIGGRLGYRLGLGDTKNFNERIQDSLNASKISIIKKYFSNGWPLLFGLRMNTLIYFCIAGILLSLISGKFSKTISQNRTKLLSLDIIAAASFLGPLSWFVLASGHSYIHLHINYLLWSMPFLILCGAVLFTSISYLVSDLFEKYRFKILAVPFAIFLIWFYFYCNSFSYPSKLKNDVVANGKKIYSSENVSVYLQKNFLYYITNKKNDNSKRYFLHFHTDDKQVQSQTKYGFVNRDFAFSEKKLPLPAWSKERMAAVKIPDDFYVTKISTGQYEGKTRFWQTKVPVYEYFDTIEKFTVQNLTDKNWLCGFHRTSNIILVQSDNLAFKYLAKKTILLPDKSEAKITSVARTGKYYHIHTDRHIMFDSNNVTIKILKGKKDE